MYNGTWSKRTKSGLVLLLALKMKEADWYCRKYSMHQFLAFVNSEEMILELARH